MEITSHNSLEKFDPIPFCLLFLQLTVSISSLSQILLLSSNSNSLYPTIFRHHAMHNRYKTLCRGANRCGEKHILTLVNICETTCTDEISNAFSLRLYRLFYSTWNKGKQDKRRRKWKNKISTSSSPYNGNSLVHVLQILRKIPTWQTVFVWYLLCLLI